MDKRFWLVIVAIVVVLGGVFIFTNNRKAGAPSGSAGTLTNHVEGSTTSGVKLVEYGDFQCPACASFHDAVTQVAEKYNGQIQFQFRNFPLFQIHPNAIAAARAAEAADIQGKYWPMHNLLYQENIKYINGENTGQKYDTWVNASDASTYFKSYAVQLGLNTTKFETDFKSSAVNGRVQADLKEGNKLGVDSTPTFFLDGKKISNPDPTIEAFSKIIDAEIAKKTPATPAPSVTPAPSAASDTDTTQ